MKARVFTVSLGCNGCPAEVLGTAPIRGDDDVAIEQARRAARRHACVLAESLGWAVAPHGYERDLCPACRGAK